MKTAYLGLAQTDKASEDFIFHSAIQSGAPTHFLSPDFKRKHSTAYTVVPIAQSDHTPREFRANNAGELSVNIEIFGDRNIDVEPSLAKLRGYMRKDKRTGEPPDLVLVVGKKSWTVRIDSIEFSPKLWNDKLDEQRVHVALQLHTVAWEK
jgi:hypothetical protein